MNTPNISIIIPCYNVEKYFNRCINTIVNQTLKDIEIILVDDASPDKVPVLCDDWGKKDFRIKVIHKKENEGLGFARNTGLDVASGEYVAFVDSDDYVDVTMYEILYNKAKKTNSDIVYCGVKSENREGHFVDICDYNITTTFKNEQLESLSINYFDPPKGEHLHFMSVWHSIYRRETVGNLRFYSEREVCSEDLPFQVAILLKANIVTYIPNTLYYYCLNDTSLSRTFNFEKCFRYFTLANIIERYYSENQKAHVWRFFFKFSQFFIRGLIRADISYTEKIQWLKKFCEHKEIVKHLKSTKNELYKRPKRHLTKLYFFAMTKNQVFLLYLTAMIDEHIICNKCGVKSFNKYIHHIKFKK